MKHFDKLANEVLTGLTKTADSRVEFMGIDTRPFAARENRDPRAWRDDLKKLVDEWWSFYRKDIKDNAHKLRFDFEVNDRLVSIEVKGQPQRKVMVDVNGTSKSFGPRDSLYDIILWIDRLAMRRMASAKRR